MFPSIGSFQRCLDRCVGVVQSLGVSSAVTRISSIHHSKQNNAPTLYTCHLHTKHDQVTNNQDNDNQFLTNITRYTTNPNPSIARRVPSNRLFRPLGELAGESTLLPPGLCVLRCARHIGCRVLWDAQSTGPCWHRSGIGQRARRRKRGSEGVFACDAGLEDWNDGTVLRMGGGC